MLHNNDKFIIESNDVMILHDTNKSSNDEKLLFSSHSDDVTFVVKNFVSVTKFLDNAYVDSLGNNCPHFLVALLNNDTPSPLTSSPAKYNSSNVEQTCDCVFSTDIKQFDFTSNSLLTFYLIMINLMSNQMMLCFYLTSIILLTIERYYFILAKITLLLLQETSRQSKKIR